jgi:HEAT repeat protein
VHDSINSAVPGVRTAAIEAIGVCGEPSDVPTLCKLIADGPTDADRDAAARSLQAIRSQTADQALIACIRSAPQPAQIRLIQVLTDRNIIAAAGELMTMATRAEPPVRVAAFKALGKLLPPAELPALIELMIRQDAAAIGPAEKAVVAVARRGSNPDDCAAAVLEPLASQQPVPTRCTLVRVLGGIGGPKALDATCAAMKHEDPAVRDTAMRTLANWPDARAVDVLLSIFKSTADPGYRGLALAGFTRLLGADQRAGDDKVKLLAELMPAMKDTAERKQLLAAMADVPDAGALTLIDQTLAADASVRSEADLAKLKVARAIAGSNPDVALPTARSLMKEAAGENIRKEAAKIVRQLKK